MTWDYDRVEAMAPDTATLKRAEQLAFVGRWQQTGRLENITYGVVRGTGAQPYQTIVDETRTEFSCTCRSRKRPCKHALGLAIILATRPETIPGAPPPEWVLEWIAGRAERTAKKAARDAKKDEPVDEETAARRRDGVERRAAEREAKVRQGVEDLARWLRDIVRQGVAAQAEHSYRFWDEMASRMIDAQAPGLAKMVRALGGVPHSGEGWASRFLEHLARIHLVVEAYQRHESLPSDVAEEVRMRVGFKQSKEQVLEAAGVVDQWWVTGQWVEQDDEDALSTQRTWLFGRTTRRAALVLDFKFGGAPHDRSLHPGTCVAAELGFYAGSWPVRALLRNEPERVACPLGDLVDMCETLAENFERMSSILERLPWAARIQARVRDVVPVHDDGVWTLNDGHSEVTMVSDRTDPWPLLAISGGRPITVFGEWIGDALLPHGAVAADDYVPFLSGMFATW